MEIMKKKKTGKKIRIVGICVLVALLLALIIKIRYGPAFYEYDGVWRHSSPEIALASEQYGGIRLGIDEISETRKLSTVGNGYYRVFDIVYDDLDVKIWNVHVWIYKNKMLLYVRKDYKSNYTGRFFLLTLDENASTIE